MATQSTVIYASPTISGNKPLVASAQYTTFAMQRTSGEGPALRYRVVKAYITGAGGRNEHRRIRLQQGGATDVGHVHQL